MATKTYVTTVFDETSQSMDIMDVPGFSHFGPVFDLYRNGFHINARYAYITGTNKAVVAKAVKEALADHFIPNLHYVEQFDPQWHRNH